MERTIRTILRVKVKMGGKKFLKKRRNRYDWKIIDDDRMMGGKIAGSLDL